MIQNVPTVFRPSRYENRILRFRNRVVRDENRVWQDGGNLLSIGTVIFMDEFWSQVIKWKYI